MTERKKRHVGTKRKATAPLKTTLALPIKRRQKLRPALRKLQDNNQAERSETRGIEDNFHNHVTQKTKDNIQAEPEEQPFLSASCLNMPEDTESDITCSKAVSCTKSADVAQEIAANTMNVKEDVKRVEKLLNNCQIENASHYESLSFILTRIDSSKDAISDKVKVLDEHVGMLENTATQHSVHIEKSQNDIQSLFNEVKHLEDNQKPIPEGALSLQRNDESNMEVDADKMIDERCVLIRNMAQRTGEL